MRDRGNHPLVNRRGVGLAILLLFFSGPLFPAVKQPLAASRDEQFNGRWDIKTSGERLRAWWLEIENAGTPAAKGKFISAFSDRKSTRLNSSHLGISYAVLCLKKKSVLRNLNTAYPFL